MPLSISLSWIQQEPNLSTVKPLIEFNKIQTLKREAFELVKSK